MDPEAKNRETPMDTGIELQQLKAAWKTLDRRMELGHRLQLEHLRARKVRSARGSLLPLALSLMALMIFALALIVLGASAWSSGSRDAWLVGSAVALHVYGVFTLAGAGATLGKMAAIDFAAPVLVIQRRLIALEQRYIRFGWAVGLPWFVLWVPVVICLPKAEIGSLTWLVLNIAVGACSVAALLLLRALALRPGHEHWRRWLHVSAGTRALARARAHIDELDQFERDFERD